MLVEHKNVLVAWPLLSIAVGQSQIGMSMTQLCQLLDGMFRTFAETVYILDNRKSFYEKQLPVHSVLS